MERARLWRVAFGRRPNAPVEVTSILIGEKIPCEITLCHMNDEVFGTNGEQAGGRMSRRLFLRATLASGATLLVGRAAGGNTRPGPDKWVPDGRPEYLKQCVDKSLKRLKLERIDLYQLHRVDPKVPMEDSLGALKEAQTAGKIRHIGLSEVSPEQVQRARKIVPIVTVQNRYNITDRKWDSTLAYCEKEKIGFMPWAPVGGTRGMSSAALEKVAKDRGITVYQLGLAWLLHRSPVMLPIPGTSSLAHLDENMAARKIQLTAEEWKTIDAVASQT